MMTTLSARTGRRDQPVRSAPGAQPPTPISARSNGAEGRVVAPLTAGPAIGAIVAWGAGLVAAALGAGGVMGGSVVPTVGGVALVTLAACALAWGALTLARGRFVAPRTATALALVTPVLLGVEVASDPARLSVLGAAMGVALSMVVGVLVAAGLRAASRTPDGRAPARGGMIALLVAAAVTTVLVVPALGAIQDAQLRPGQVVHMDDMEGMHGH